MRPMIRSALAALAATGLAVLAADAQQAAPAGKAAGAAPTPARPPALTKEQRAKLDEVLATVNGDKITRAQLLQFLSQYQITPGSEQTAYTSGLDILINTRLLTQFLNENRVKVDEAEVDKIIDEQTRALRASNTSLESALAESGTTLEQLRQTIRESRQWRTFILKASTDKVLSEYMEANRDFFSNARVKVSHIQLNLDPAATPAEKAAARDKLLKIKKEIESGSISFADAANKYSEDPSNKQQPTGGDLRWITRKGPLTESFSAAAFALPKGKISDPVETEYGLHLIQVTDRREDKMPTLEQVKEKAQNQYAVDEQDRIVQEMRKKAKIDIKPMPADLFGPRPAAEAPKAAATPKA